jgi:hypothetical protein
MEKQSGSGLVFAVILLFVIIGMVVTLSSITLLETKMNQKTKSSVGAFYSAESGIEWTLNRIANNSGSKISDVFDTDFSGGKVTPSGLNDIVVYLLDSNGDVIDSDDLISNVKSVRSVGSEGVGNTTRAIEASVAASGITCKNKFFDNTPSPPPATTGDPDKNIVTCPAGTVISGGGFVATGGSAFTGVSAPFNKTANRYCNDDEEVESGKCDSWKACWANASGTLCAPGGFGKTYAICCNQ